MNCSHPGCNCKAGTVEREGRRYCSEDCANAGESRGQGGCTCGHPNCK